MAQKITEVTVSQCPACGGIIVADILDDMQTPLSVSCKNVFCTGKLTVTIVKTKANDYTYRFKQTFSIGC